MSVFSAVKQLVLEYLGLYTPPVPPLYGLCGRCGQPRSAACGDDFFSVTDPLFPRLAGGPAAMVDWGALQQQITTSAEAPKPLLREITIGRDGLAPVYYTAHPDGLYRVADPQPHSGIGWGCANAEHITAKVAADQLRFLLSQAPMIDAPADLFNAGRAVTKFAYVHPKTFAAFTRGAYAPKSSAPYVQISPSRTKWVITTLMPEKVVIYTPNPLPGIEKLLAI